MTKTELQQELDKSKEKNKNYVDLLFQLKSSMEEEVKLLSKEIDHKQRYLDKINNLLSKMHE